MIFDRKTVFFFIFYLITEIVLSQSFYLPGKRKYDDIVRVSIDSVEMNISNSRISNDSLYFSYNNKIEVYGLSSINSITFKYQQIKEFAGLGALVMISIFRYANTNERLSSQNRNLVKAFGLISAGVVIGIGSKIPKYGVYYPNEFKYSSYY